MFDLFPGGLSDRLDRSSYHEDFYRVFTSGIRFLNKLERGQNFKERGFASWEAFATGDWETSLSLVEEKRDVYRKQFAEAGESGVRQRRLRVVELPVKPYVQWEMHVLRLRVELGDDIRVITTAAVADVERERPVPEVVILGGSVVYEVQYDEDGNADGARRYRDPALIAETNEGFESLWERSEAFGPFFEREIAPLGAPAVGA